MLVLRSCCPVASLFGLSQLLKNSVGTSVVVFLCSQLRSRIWLSLGVVVTLSECYGICLSAYRGIVAYDGATPRLESSKHCSHPSGRM
jgi:hypothetical protein